MNDPRFAEEAAGDDILIIEDRVERKGTHILVTLYGQSGSGKTLSALLMARGLVGDTGRLVLLDTENGRGRMYADQIPGGYSYAALKAPFTPERYIAALTQLEKAGYAAAVIDSGSHEWEGFGGVLEIAERNGKTGLLKWKDPKTRHKAFKQTMWQNQMHLFICLRAKEKLVDGRDETGKKTLVSAGFFPVQEADLKFEMTVQLFMYAKGPRGGFYMPEKVPGALQPALPGGDQQIGVEAGRALAAWIAGDTKTDKALDNRVREGEEAAARGSEIFRVWWNRDDIKPHRVALKPHLPNFQSIAAEADRVAIEDDPFLAPGAIDPENPFGAQAEVAE
jgi:hypothetical protein